MTHPGVTVNWQCSTRNFHLHSLITTIICNTLCTQRAQGIDKLQKSNDHLDPQTCWATFTLIMP